MRNLSSAGTRARQELRDEKDLVDCLVWIIRIGVKSQHFDEKVSGFFLFFYFFFQKLHKIKLRSTVLERTVSEFNEIQPLATRHQIE